MGIAGTGTQQGSAAPGRAAVHYQELRASLSVSPLPDGLHVPHRMGAAVHMEPAPLQNGARLLLRTN